MRSIHIVVVTGMSGSGKSTAIRALEDLGYFCVDNLPVLLLPRFLELVSQSQHSIQHVALVIDVREGAFLDDARATFAQVEAAGHTLEIVFLEADTDVLVRRYSETRRRHPLAPHGAVRQGIEQEIKDMAELRHMAQHTVNTSSLTVHDLKRRIQDLFNPEPDSAPRLTVNVLSFGFKHGLPSESDLVFDVRFLTNPYFVEALRTQSGRHPDVAAYVLHQSAAQTFLTHVHDLLDFLLPQYLNEGKTYLTIAVGCTGGQHRSVAIAEAVARRLAPLPYVVNVRHRDATEPDPPAPEPTEAASDDPPDAAP